MAQAKRGFPLKPGTSVKKVLGHLQLIHGDRICNGAILAFGKKPQQFFTTAITKCAHFHGLIVQKPIPDHKVFQGDVFQQVVSALDFVLSKISLSVGTRELSVQAPIQYEIPKDIIDEAIVNAIAHRDYNNNGSVQVMLFADRLEIYNPGGLISLLTVKQLMKGHPSYPTNPKLAEPMYQAGYIERFGTGTEEIFRLAKEAGLKKPTVDLEGGFKITIWRPDTPQLPRKHPASTPQAGQQQGNSRTTAGQQQGNSREIDNLVLVLEGEMNRGEIQQLIGLKHKVKFLKNYIQPAIAGGYLELTIPEKPNSPKQSYRLTGKGLQLQKELREIQR